jgi:hypothetical protein
VVKTWTTFIALLLVCARVPAEQDIWKSLFNQRLRVAASGDAEAQYELGTLYQNGRGTPIDRDKAIEWYRRSADHGNLKAASRLERMKENEVRFDMESERANSGDPEGQYALGTMYAKGVGVTVDKTRAVSWYRRAAEQGHEKAQYKLGYLLYHGEGVKRSTGQALTWFRTAAVKGYAPAQYHLGMMYAAGDGVKRDYDAAISWFRKAAKGGYRQARDEIEHILNGTKHTRADGDDTEPPSPHVRQMKEWLLLGEWQRDQKPVGFMPSNVSKCEEDEQSLVCLSDELHRENPTTVISYSVRSIISEFGDDNTFSIQYRNLVLSVLKNAGNVPEDFPAYEDKTVKGYDVNTGWTRSHNLECRFEDAEHITCIKDGLHTIEYTRAGRIATR